MKKKEYITYSEYAEAEGLENGEYLYHCKSRIIQGGIDSICIKSILQSLGKRNGRESIAKIKKAVANNIGLRREPYYIAKGTPTGYSYWSDTQGGVYPEIAKRLYEDICEIALNMKGL